MPKTNPNIRTFRDIASSSPPQTGSFSGYTENPSAADIATHQAAASKLDPKNSAAGKIVPSIHHIPSLNNAEFSRSLLERVVAEFLPIIQRRQYNVLSVSEMCCCGDGLDSVQTNNGGRRRRKNRMANNVWGYNQTMTGGRTRHEIHLRLRHVQAHQSRFLTYQDVAGTMAHELAHCERGPHDKRFFAIMEGILDEHASLLASRLNSDGTVSSDWAVPSSGDSATANISSFHGEGQRLGGNSSAKSRLLVEQQGRKLGGQAKKRLTPQQAAAAAAEFRKRQLRLAGTRCCRPCAIVIDDDDDENVKPPAVASKRSKSTTVAENDITNTKSADQQTKQPLLIDLTADEDDDDDEDTSVIDTSPRPSPVNVTDWSCPNCTYLNSFQKTSCDMCLSPRP